MTASAAGSCGPPTAPRKARFRWPISGRADDLLPLGNGVALFSADDGVHGREFWITDGSAAGTRLVADIWPGGGPANPGGIPASPYPPSAAPGGQGGMLALGDGRALFSATDPLHGTELWITDGTAGGTWLVKDINGATQGFASSTPSQFAALGDGRVVFTADDGILGAEAWITDGTGAGTHLLRDIHPGATASAAAGYLLLSSDSGEDPTAGCRQPCQHTCDFLADLKLGILPGSTAGAAAPSPNRVVASCWNLLKSNEEIGRRGDGAARLDHAVSHVAGRGPRPAGRCRPASASRPAGAVAPRRPPAGWRRRPGLARPGLAAPGRRG